MTIMRSFLVGFLLFVGATGAVAAGLDVGKVAAVRGKATIERGGSTIPASVNTTIQASDIVKTSADCRVKLVFIDDSVLTVGENSRLLVKEFLYSKEKGGKSIFNLLDGKMHSVVGKTKFEVQTPTAVAAARGTVIYFEVGNVDEEQPDQKNVKETKEAKEPKEIK